MLPVNLPAILVSNLIAAGLCIMILLSKRRSIRWARFDDRTFYLFSALLVVIALLEMLGFVLDGHFFPGARQLYLLEITATYLIAAAMGPVWLVYVESKVFSSHDHLKKWLPLYLLPSGLMGVLLLLNLENRLFFWICDQMVYHRGPLMKLAFLTTFGYLVWGLVLAARYQKQVFWPLAAFVLPAIGGTFLQILLYGVTLMWLCAALGLTQLYFSLQNQVAQTDPLTGLYNRNYLFGCLEQTLASHREMAGILLDLNDFKRINDTYGHQEGDEALVAVAQVLQKAVGRKGVACRYAGDEFVVVLHRPAPGDLQQLKTNILTELERVNQSRNRPYRLSLSMGACTMTPNSVDDFFQAMDQAMYQEKHAYHNAF